MTDCRNAVVMGVLGAPNTNGLQTRNTTNAIAGDGTFANACQKSQSNPGSSILNSKPN
jgi:hypothetical protein